MTWFKVDDGFCTHPKVIATSLSARGLWVTAGSWCSQHLTNGFVPERAIAMFGARSSDVKELVSSGLWIPVDGGWQFHDWEVHQPSKDDVETKRSAARERMRKLRGSSPPVRANGARSSPPVRDSFTTPVPSRPDLKERERALELKEPQLDTGWIKLGRHYKTLFDAEQEGSRNPRPYNDQRITSTDSKQFRKLLELVKLESERTGVASRELFEAAAQAFLRDPKQREKGLVLEYFARDFTRYVDVTGIATAS